MDYGLALDTALNRLHDEGRYRTFIDIERRRGAYPEAVWRRPDGTERTITVWCGNDYLGMGQHPAVLAASFSALVRWGLSACPFGGGEITAAASAPFRPKRLASCRACLAARINGRNSRARVALWSSVRWRRFAFTDQMCSSTVASPLGSHATTGKSISMLRLRSSS